MNDTAIRVHCIFTAVCLGWIKRHFLYAARLPALYVTRLAFRQEHLNDVLGTTAGKQLPLVLFFIGNAVLVQQGNEVVRRIARQRRAAKLGVLAHIVFVWGAYIQVPVRKVAAPTT